MNLNENALVDLHIHTTASDGTWTAEEVILEARDKNIGLISITDHDDVSSLREGVIKSEKHPINFIKGVEVSSTYNGEMFHILGYGIDENNKELDSLLEYNRGLMNKKDDNIIEILIERGYNIELLDYGKYQHNPKRGGWKALSFLIDKGICKDVNDFFQNIFIKDDSAMFPEFQNPYEVINVIKKSGGIPILAHPYYSHTECEVHKRLSIFLEMGVQGFECFHPNHSKDTTQRCVEWCKKYNTIITAGSDCHGEFIRARQMGNPKVSVSELNLGQLLEVIE